ncbi:MAG TPA: hypothetical protein VFN46_01570 [Acetobacteraceae bacterium]|nr:hypothetical protein [Acetobacteraceae bacterium]
MSTTADTHAIRLLDQLGGTLKLARALVQSGRAIDLDGLAELAGRSCAASLDLPPEQGRALRPRLVALLADVDALAASCRTAAAEDAA